MNSTFYNIITFLKVIMRTNISGIMQVYDLLISTKLCKEKFCKNYLEIAVGHNETGMI